MLRWYDADWTPFMIATMQVIPKLTTQTFKPKPLRKYCYHPLELISYLQMKKMQENRQRNKKWEKEETSGHGARSECRVARLHGVVGEYYVVRARGY
jgi:hypothetical protein